MASSIPVKIILLTACLCWSSCLSQNPEEDLLAFVREAVERIKDMAEKVEDLREKMDGLSNSQKALVEKVEEMDNRFTAKFEDLRETLDGLNELQKIERSMEGCSSVEQQLSNLTMVLTKDECAEGSHCCSPLAVCEDAIVSYRCICLPGYTGDGFTCEDVDMCASVEDRCHEHAECRNIIGSYTCACNPGFDGDGFNCHEVPCVHPNFTIPGINGCLTLVRELKTWPEAQSHCRDGGGQLVQGWDSNAQSELLSDYVNKALGSSYNAVWVGSQGRRWTEGKADVPSVLFGVSYATTDYLKNFPYGVLATDYMVLMEYSRGSSLYIVCQRTSLPSSSSSSSSSSSFSSSSST